MCSLGVDAIWEMISLLSGQRDLTCYLDVGTRTTVDLEMETVELRKSAYARLV